MLRAPSSVAQIDNVYLDIYLILYDMLNDDDEELRDLATATASLVLSYSTVSPSKAVSLAPLNASELFAGFLASNYAASRQLCNGILQYISGRTPRLSDPIDKRGLTPVSSLVSEYRKESTVLFVEEKQNLFVDDVREVELWCRTLHLLAKSSYGSGDSLREIATWASEGLDYLSKTVAGSTGTDGPLGWTSKPEIFTLGVRVICISAAMVSPMFPAGEILDSGCKQALKKGLESLLRDGSAASVNGEWLARVQAGLES